MVLNKFKAYRILNSKGQNIGRQDYYFTAGKAKAGAAWCTYRLDEGSRIVEIEVEEKITAEINILLGKEDAIGCQGQKFDRPIITGYSDDNKTLKTNTPTRIQFNS